MGTKRLQRPCAQAALIYASDGEDASGHEAQIKPYIILLNSDLRIKFIDLARGEMFEKDKFNFSETRNP